MLRRRRRGRGTTTTTTGEREDGRHSVCYLGVEYGVRSVDAAHDHVRAELDALQKLILGSLAIRLRCMGCEERRDVYGEDGPPAVRADAHRNAQGLANELEGGVQAAARQPQGLAVGRRQIDVEHHHHVRHRTVLRGGEEEAGKGGRKEGREGGMLAAPTATGRSTKRRVSRQVDAPAAIDS